MKSGILDKMICMGLKRRELSNDRLAGDQDLDNETSDSNHGKSAVLHFIDLVLLDLIWSTQVQGVETEVSTRCVGFLECDKFDEADHGNDLNPADDRNGVDSLERVRLRVQNIGQMNKFLNHHTESSKHTNTAMLQFRGGSIIEVDVVRQVQRIKSIITRTRSVQFRWPFQKRDSFTLGHTHIRTRAYPGCGNCRPGKCWSECGGECGNEGGHCVRNRVQVEYFVKNIGKRKEIRKNGDAAFVRKEPNVREALT